MAYGSALQLVGEVEDLGLLGRAQVVVGQEVPRASSTSLPVAAAASSSSGRARRSCPAARR